MRRMKHKPRSHETPQATWDGRVHGTYGAMENNTYHELARTGPVPELEESRKPVPELEESHIGRHQS